MKKKTKDPKKKSRTAARVLCCYSESHPKAGEVAGFDLEKSTDWETWREGTFAYSFVRMANDAADTIKEQNGKWTYEQQCAYHVLCYYNIPFGRKQNAS